ncbi:MAG: alpha-amylase family glycosyl hydrolase, partial [Bacteroidota bacterium]
SPMRVLLLVLLLVMPAAFAQDFSDAERLQGYALRGDTTVVLFDPGHYGLGAIPERVVITGALVGWDTNMDDPDRQLRPVANAAGLWALSLFNPSYAVIGPRSPFKFRVDDGQWLDPPGSAPNAEGGNLVFLHDVTPSSMRAELRGERALWVKLEGDGLRKSTRLLRYKIVDAHGNETPVAAVLPNQANEFLVVPAEDLALNRIYFVEYSAPGSDQPLRAWASFDGLWRTLYSEKPLGAEIADDGSRTDIRLFAPRADGVTVNLYDDRTGDATASHELVRDSQGVWEIALDGDLHGTYYDFEVVGPDDPGNHFFNQEGVRVTDPYARVSDDGWGRARIWRATEPATPLAGGIPAMEDVIAYEVHVQDFTDRLPVSDDLKGTIPAMTMTGLTNSRGEPIGFDYLKDLGVNVVHLMPMQEFLHYPDDVWQAAFADDPFMQAQGVADENYQWGYRITHYMAVESRFRQRGTEPGAEREQFRDLVQAFHDEGMAVIVDFVFNHTGENMEGTQQLLNFNGIDKLYYYRILPDLFGTFDHIGVFGNEVKSEDRPMVQRWLIDQCLHFIEEFGVDGFRIDLAGQTDEQTLRAVREAIGRDKIVYGEPWIGSNDPAFEANPDWDWYKIDSPITFFQDDARNAFKGPTSDPTPAVESRGFAGGDGAVREQTIRALSNRFPDEATPNMGINYLDIHDNWALPDRYARNKTGADAWDGRAGVDEDRFRVAATLLFTSLGPIVLNGGSEMLRSKGVAPLQSEMGGQKVLETAMTPVYINGRGDTYNLRTANQYDWETVGATPADGAANDYAAMLAFWRGLIHFRLSEAGAVFRKGEVQAEGYYRFLTPDHTQLLGYVVDDRVLVLVNSSDAPQTFSGVDLAGGTWTLVSDGQRIDHEDGLGETLDGGQAHDVAVPERTAMIWVRE